MKVLVLLALCASVAVSLYTPAVHTSVFKPGEEYVYHYRAQVLSGIPKSSKQFSGLFLDTIVRLQFQQDYKVVLKMEKIKLFKINNKISELETELLPESQMTRLTGEQFLAITEQLVKPVKFTYEEGQINEVETERSDKLWSCNIKKGLLSLLQVTLKDKTESSGHYSDPLINRMRGVPSQRHGYRSSYTPVTPYWKLANKANSAYEVMETDIMGTCETQYSLISDKSHISSTHMQLTAVKNFNKCVTKPFLIEGLFQGVYSHPQEKELIEPSVHTEYVITGDRSHFLIKEATLRGKYLFLVNGIEGTDMSTHIFQHLTLKNTEAIRTPIHLQSSKVEPKGLIMHIPQSSILPEKEQMYEREYPTFGRQSYSARQQRRPYQNTMYSEEPEYVSTETTTDITPIVEEKLSELVQCLYPSSVEKQCSMILYELTRLVREMKKEELKQLIITNINNKHSSDIHYRKSEILLDILPTLPKPEAAKILIELIKEQKISEVRSSILFKLMTLTVKPTPEVIRKSLELYKELPKERSSTVSEKTMQQQSVLLGVGTLTHRLITIMKEQSKPVPEVISFVENISNELLKMLEETRSEHEKILILKSLGNMGASETIVPLKAIIEDVEQPTVIRVNAIFALRKLARQFKNQVIPILLNVYMDTKEVRELRQASFVVIINANPDYATIQMLAHRIRHEPSSQLRTLVYSTLVNLAMYTSHQPEHKQLIKDVRMVLKTIKPVHVGVHDSVSVLINKFVEDFDMGGALSLMKIKSRHSGLPESFIANLQATLFGKHRRLAEVGVEGKSLEVILRKLVGPNGLINKIVKGEISLEDLFRPLNIPEMGEVQRKIKDIVAQMVVDPTSKYTPYTSVYTHILGNELQYILINSQNIEEVARKVNEMIPEMLMKLTQGIRVDVVKSLSHIASLTIPSPLGIPLSLNYTSVGILKVEGHVKVTGMPTWSEMMNRFSSLSVPRLGLEVDLKPVVDMSHYVTMGADMKWLSTGVSGSVDVKSHLPIKFITQLDPVQHSVSVKFFTPKQTTKLVHLKATPLTFIKYVPVTMHKLPFTLEINEMKAEEIVKQMPFNYKYDCPVSGQQVEMEGVYSLCGPMWCPIMPLFGKQELFIVTRPTLNVDFVLFKVKSVRSNLEFEGIPSHSSLEQLFEKDPEEFEQEQSMYTSTNYRTVSRSMIESGEFDEIPVEPIFTTSPIKRQLLFTVGPNTQQTPKVKALFTWLMSRQYWENQLNVQVIRQAYNQMPTWKINLNNVLNARVWYPEIQFRGENEFLNKFTAVWNIGGEVNEVKFKVITGSPFEFSEELRQHSLLPSILTDTLPEANAQKYKYTVVMETPQMTHTMLKYITKVHDLIKIFVYKKLTTVLPVQPLHNKVIVSVELMPWWEKMNVIVKTPREESYISSVPFYWNIFHPTSEKMSMHDVPAWKWYKSMSDPEYFRDTVPYKSTPFFSGECKVDSEKLITFDGQEVPLYSLKNTLSPNVKVVLAQHCSSVAPLFSISASKTPESSQIKIMMPSYEMNFIKPVSYQRPTVIINGEEKSLPIGQPIYLRDTYTQSSFIPAEKSYIVEQVEPNVFKVKSEQLGLTIIIDAIKKETKIKLSPLSMLQGEVCGLCGNYNQDTSDDIYTTSDMKLTNQDFPSFIRNNLVNKQSFSVEQIADMSNEYCMKSEHITVDRYDNEMSLTCLTETKLPQCAPGCTAEKTTSVKTCFTCRAVDPTVSLPAQTYLAPRWDSYEPSDVTCSDFYQRVEIPTRCVPVY